VTLARVVKKLLICVSEYYRVVEDDLAISNGSCVAAVGDATLELNMLLKDPLGHKTVNEMFK
jgi:peptidyl-tRNA hydrolase